MIPLYICPDLLILLTSLVFWLLYCRVLSWNFLGTIKLKLGLHCYTDWLCERWKIQHNSSTAPYWPGPVDHGTRIPSWFIPQVTHTICFFVNEFALNSYQQYIASLCTQAIYRQLCIRLMLNKRCTTLPNVYCCLFASKKVFSVILTDFESRGGTPIHYLYGYVPPNGVVILKLLI